MELLLNNKVVKTGLGFITTLSFIMLAPGLAAASEGYGIVIPQLDAAQNNLLYLGIVICLLGMLFGVYQFKKVKKMKAHQSMLDVAQTIYETCKTYLIQQGKFLAILFGLIALVIAFYFGYLVKLEIGSVFFILMWTVIGMLGSYGVAWYGIRMNTYANSRVAFSSLERKPLKMLNIALDAGMSIGVMLVCVELIMMLMILLFVPRELAGASFIGFAIGESLGAVVLRIAGGIFTKIADIGADLMKIVFGIEEDDPRNPGVIADCTGDNAGDSVGPTADGFETYGVTGVAMITFIVLAVAPALQTMLLTWIFAIRVLMLVSAITSYFINRGYTNAKFGQKDDFDFESPLSSLVWITSIFSIALSFVLTYYMIGPGSSIETVLTPYWSNLAMIFSLGTLAAAVIPEAVKVFTSPNSKHVAEVVQASREGGPSLNILSGLVAGNFSAFWIGLIFVVIMFAGYWVSLPFTNDVMSYHSVFAFALIAYGMLGMGPITIAVDSYGPVTDNAQSIYELSLIEEVKDVDQAIEKDFGFKPDFEKSKYYLESNDGAGNTFKATAKPVLIGTAVVGATAMIFSLILVIRNELGVAPESILTLLNPYTLLGFICGGAVIYWFTGASTQAVTTGAYRAVQYIKEHINLDVEANVKANTESSKEVVRICTQYAQNGMLNIFIALFTFALGFALIAAPVGGNVERVSFFVSFLISIAIFGLFQAVFMANAGGCWDNAKKVVEVDLAEKGTPLHEATIVGDTVGDPFKDTSSVALNPIIKFTTLFGLLAMEIAISEAFRDIAPYVGIVLLVIAMYFVWRTFYGMRIPAEK